MPDNPRDADRLEMPAPTLWPLVLAAAITFMGMGFVTSWVFTIVGTGLFFLALGNWIGLLWPGQGTALEELRPAEERSQPVLAHTGEVMHIRAGMPGHRMRIPEKVHPYSAGAKGGLIGGAVMTIPALIYGLVSEYHSIWFPINLLVGMVLPLPTMPDGNIDAMRMAEFHFGYLLMATFIHVILSIGLGLMYGVLLPMFPGRPFLWGSIVAPLLWSGAAYGFMGVLNPALQKHVYWPAFVLSQFIYGIVVGIVVMRTEKVFVDKRRRALAAAGGNS